MSSFTFTDHKFGGRLLTACDAVSAGHLHKAASIFSEITEELNVEATASAMAEEGVESSTVQVEQVISPPSTPAPTQQPSTQDLQSCSRGAHSFGAPDANGWRTCFVCQTVNVTPPSDGPIDMSEQR